MQFYHASWYSATFQCVINSAVGHFEQNLFNWLFVIFWVNILGYSENFPWNRKLFNNLFDRICHYVVLPNSALAGFMSTPIIRAAPAFLAPIAAASPTPPSPHIATVDPGRTLAVLRAAP